MSEDIDSRRDDSGATAPAPRVAGEPTPPAPAARPNTTSRQPLFSYNSPTTSGSYIESSSK